MSPAKSESPYKRCAAAIQRLISDPPKDHEGVFTEIDVISEAATRDWGKNEYDKAMHQANEACGKRYRDEKLCRYGPVKIGRGESAIEDYARIAGKIVYADAVTGPKVWKTPNGTFKKLMAGEDHLSRQGRNGGANRNDAEPWDQQALPAKPRRRRKDVGRSPKNRDVMDLAIKLSSQVKELQNRVDTLEEREARREKSMRAELEAAAA